MLAALAGVLGRGAAAGAAESGTYALAKSGGGPPPIPGAASQSKQAANSLLSVTQNLNKTDKAAKEVAKGGGQNYLDHLKEARGQYSQSVGIFQQVTSKIEGAGAALTGAMTVGIVALQAIADPIAQLTGLAAPAALEAFTRAVNDDFAVIGRALLPVTEAMTRSFEKLGSFLAGAEPILNTVATAMASVIDRVGGKWLDAIKEMGPTLELIGDGFVVVANIAGDMAVTLLSVAKWLSEVRNKFLSLLGITGSSFNKDASAKGAAVRDVRVVTSAESVSNEAQAKALQQALNPGTAKQKEPVEVQQSIFDLLQNFFDNKCPSKQDLIDFLGKLPSLLLSGAKNALSGSVGDAASSVSPLLSLIRSQLTR